MLADALVQPDALHLPGARERHRRLLEGAMNSAHGALAASKNGGGDASTITGARSTLVKAHAARAEDARHGAGQLSRGAQRAPTREACDDGWQRVEAIVAVAEASADAAARLALELDAAAVHKAAVHKAARAAEAAAREARKIVDERNHAYTFHTDPGFSFGEGWYLAAAAALAGVAIQIEPDQAQTLQAERFVRDAGLSAQLTPYRSRPRANKHLPDIIAHAFHANPLSAQRALRAAFLGDASIGDAPISPAVMQWTDGVLAGASSAKKVLLWVRHCAYHSTRNTTHPEIVELTQRALAAGCVPILFGDAVGDGEVPLGAVDLTLCWKEPLFQGADMRRAQLQLFEHLKGAHALVGQLGVTTAGMDGPALMGLPTMYLTAASNVRMREWVGSIPGYEEVVRSEGYLEGVSDTLGRWASTGPCP
ncbi:MAG: hypothetical protein JRH20_26720 [Deltaproteobacteria bacterium]|nr:hypothetical protein [Deltaproteobacteria bacterium]